MPHIVRKVFDGKIELYLGVYRKKQEDDDSIEVPWFTILVLYVLKQSQVLKVNDSIKIFFKAVSSTSCDSKDRFKVRKDIVESYGIQTVGESEHDLVNSCVLPALLLPEQNLCINGLCSVLRRLLSYKGGSSEALLGFQGSCLSAPAEVSPWTRFCEVDLPESTLTFIKNENKNLVLLPKDLARFEEHLKQPIRMHNIRKRMQEDLNWIENSKLEIELNTSCVKSDPITEYALSQHIYSEGPECWLSDLIIFPHLYMVVETLKHHSSTTNLEELLPFTHKWLKIMNTTQNAKENFEAVLESCFVLEEGPVCCLKLPSVPNQSLYKMEKSNTGRRIFTRQHGIDRVMAKLEETSELKLFDTNIEETTFDLVENFDWDSFPKDVHPLGGNLPPDRIFRKCQQLENMAYPVLKLAKDGDRIVDFCSGGGHLAILLAYLLPNCVVYLVENKEESLKRAIERVERLDLKNCKFFQGNMDYFCGKFDLGVSLHACGVATDLVIRACLANRASIVACPCCYGSVQDNHVIQYPRSQHFKDNNITMEEYVILGHTADQTHVNNDKHLQGVFAMNAVDSDRLHYTMEAGYAKVVLLKMRPEECTPKNNIIIAAFK